jgi:hypothetical protein
MTRLRAPSTTRVVFTALTFHKASRQNGLPKKKTALETALVDYETFQDDWELPEGHPKAIVEVLHAYIYIYIFGGGVFGGQNSPDLAWFGLEMGGLGRTAKTTRRQ